MTVVRGEAIGLEVEMAEVGECEMKDNTDRHELWYFKSDGSIRSNNGECCEAVFSRPLSLDEIQRTGCIKKLCEAADSLGAEANSSCGLHIHYNAYTLRVKNLIRIYKNFCRINDVLSIIFNVHDSRMNTYCKPNGKNVYQIKETLDCLKKRKQYRDRYYMLNFNPLRIHHSIEFRLFNGSVKENRINQYIDFVVKFVRFSLKRGRLMKLQAPRTAGELLSSYNYLAKTLKLSDESTQTFYRGYLNRVLARFNDNKENYHVVGNMIVEN